MKVAFISMHPAPYRDALIEKLIRAFPGKVDVFNLYGDDAGHRFWCLSKPGYSAEGIVGDDESVSQFRLLWRLLWRFAFSRKYDCVVWPGYVQWSVRMAIIVRASLGRRYVLCIDSVEQQSRGVFSFAVKRWMIRRAMLSFVPGRASMAFLEKTFGVSESRIVCGAYALDGETLERRVSELRRNGAGSAARDRLGIPHDYKMFLMVANMIHTRKYPVTSAGFVAFAKSYKNCVFVMVGKGPMYEQMRQYAEEHSCLRTIEGCSFDEMLGLYAAADVYVHGGKEPASTALVIGAIARLPLISSDDVGCSADLLVDGETGFKVSDSDSVPVWCDAFLRAMARESQWRKMGDGARQLSRMLDADVAAKNLSDKLNQI